MQRDGLQRSTVSLRVMIRRDHKCELSNAMRAREPDTAVSCRDQGSRVDRQKARLMWMVEDWGVDKFREMVEQQMGDKLTKGVRSARLCVMMPCNAAPANRAPVSSK